MGPQRDFSEVPLLIVPLGKMGDLIPKVVAAYIQGLLEIPVDIGTPLEIPEECYIKHRKQYDAGLILKFLRNAEPRYPFILGITTADITLPVFTYVFGEAELGGRAAVISTYRLERDIHGGHVSESVFFERIAKVALHELGHIFSLYHCNNEHCIMQFSARLESLDLLPLYYCDRCSFLLRKISHNHF